MNKTKAKPTYRIFYDKKHGSYHLIKITPKGKQTTNP